MRRFIPVLFLLGGSIFWAFPQAFAAKRPAASARPAATTQPTTLPVVRQWKPSAYPTDEVNLVIMGDWGSDGKEQKSAAVQLANYVEATHKQFYGALLAGDNFYTKLTGIKDYQWQSLFEDMYDARKLAMPFYGALGNHDYEVVAGKPKAQTEIEYAAAHPDSRWKMPSRYYRVDFPVEHPIVSVLMLDSNKPKFTPDEWQQEIAWIDAQLSDRRGAIWTMACAHHPLEIGRAHV